MDIRNLNNIFRVNDVTPLRLVNSVLFYDITQWNKYN